MERVLCEIVDIIFDYFGVEIEDIEGWVNYNLLW